MVLCWGAPGSPVVMAACGCCCWWRLRGWPSAGVPIPNENHGKRSEEMTGWGEWVIEVSLEWPWKVRVWAWSWKSQLTRRKPVQMTEAAWPLMWLPLAEGFTVPEAVLSWAINSDVWLTRGISVSESGVACPSGRQPLLKEGVGLEAVLETTVTTAAVGAGIWPEMRWSRTFLMYTSWSLVSVSCCESSLMWHLSFNLSSSCWPSPVDIAAKVHSVNTTPGIVPEVMVVVVMAGDTVVAGADGGRVPEPCSTISRAAGSATRSSAYLVLSDHVGRVPPAHPLCQTACSWHHPCSPR